jgi:hypothetical protein
MKKLYIILASGLLCGMVYGAQDTSVSDREVRDPKRLKVWLEANASDVEDRVAKGIIASTALSATNGQSVALAAPVYILTGTGGANDTTNTITISNVSAAMVGAKITLVIDAASSNLITIADSAPCYLSAAWVADNNDTLEMYVVATNVLVETSKSDN